MNVALLSGPAWAISGSVTFSHLQSSFFCSMVEQKSFMGKMPSFRMR